MTVEELQKQLAAAQAQVQQLTTQLGGTGVGTTQTENPYSVASRLSQGAKAAADAADAGMVKPMPMPQPGSNPVPMPGTDPSKPALTPEEEEYRRNRAMLADLYVRQALMEANRPYRKPVTSSKMPEDPYDKMVARQLSSPAMDSYFRMSGADQAKIDRRAGMAGMDVAGFLGLSPLDQYKAINGENVQRRNLPAGPADAGTRVTLPARPGDGGTVIPLSAGTVANASVIGRPVEGTVFTRDGASPTSFNPTTQFNAPAQTINASRKSSEIARDLTYRSNLAGAALDSLRRPAMRFGF